MHSLLSYVLVLHPAAHAPIFFFPVFAFSLFFVLSSFSPTNAPRRSRSTALRAAASRVRGPTTRRSTNQSLSLTLTSTPSASRSNSRCYREPPRASHSTQSTQSTHAHTHSRHTPFPERVLRARGFRPETPERLAAWNRPGARAPAPSCSCPLVGLCSVSCVCLLSSSVGSVGVRWLLGLLLLLLLRSARELGDSRLTGGGGEDRVGRNEWRRPASKKKTKRSRSPSTLAQSMLPRTPPRTPPREFDGHHHGSRHGDCFTYKREACWPKNGRSEQAGSIPPRLRHTDADALAKNISVQYQYRQ